MTCTRTAKCSPCYHRCFICPSRDRPLCVFVSKHPRMITDACRRSLLPSLRTKTGSVRSSGRYSSLLSVMRASHHPAAFCAPTKNYLFPSSLFWVYSVCTDNLVYHKTTHMSILFGLFVKVSDILLTIRSKCGISMVYTFSKGVLTCPSHPRKTFSPS